jgi:hypothetical protein
MSNDAYGNLGSEMKVMQTGRANLMTGIKNNRNRLRGETGQTLAAAREFLGQTGKANAHLAAQTHQMLAQSEKDAKARARQTLAEARQMAATIRKNVSALKIQAGQILVDAQGFLTRTGSDNAALKNQTRKMLANARAESKAHTRQTMAEADQLIVRTKQSVAGLKTQTGHMLADAAGVMKQLTHASRERAAAWNGILHMLHGNMSRSAAAHVVETPAATAAKAPKKAKAHARKPSRKVA